MIVLDFINVGYGDAILIRDIDEKKTALIDTGDVTTGRKKDSLRITAADFLRKEGIRTIDLLVLTHLHKDHCGGLKDLLKGVSVKRFLTNYLPPRNTWGGSVPVPGTFSAGARCLLRSMNIYLAALNVMQKGRTEIAVAEPGEIHLGKDLIMRIGPLDTDKLERQAGIWNEVLSGKEDQDKLDELDRFINDTSIRVLLQYKDHTAALPGDCYAQTWEKYEIGPCELVKLPHHGHRDSMTSSILDRMRPKQAVISVSNTRKDDCPSGSVLELLRKKGVSVQFTDAVERDGFPAVRHESVRIKW